MKKSIIYLFLLLTGLQTFGQQFKVAEPKNIALYPQQNDVRNVKKLAGIWKFKTDPQNQGENEGWFNGLTESRSVAVPGSWNEQFADLRDYRDWAWYETESFVPSSWKGERIFIRFNDASFGAKVWVNGKAVGRHEGAHVPFAFDITSMINWDQPNRISVQLENIFEDGRMVSGGFSSTAITNYDYFPYAGLNRAVYLYSVPEEAYIKDITVVTDFEGTTGKLNITVEQVGDLKKGKLIVKGQDTEIESKIQFKKGVAEVEIEIPDVKLWSPESPELYELSVILEDKNTVDRYTTKVGVRTISVDNDHILLNKKPIILKGLNKQVDFPVWGGGTVLPVVVKDIELIKWSGANSVRTSGFPHDKEFYDAADHKGILIIADSPAVGIFSTNDTAKIQKTSKLRNQYLLEMILRDKNHPSVIMWNIANEPDEVSRRPVGDESKSIAYELFAQYFQKTRELDPTRLVTYQGNSTGPSEWYDLVDVICLERYNGFYTENGEIELGVKVVSEELEALHAKFNKPCMLVGVGATSVLGFTALEPELFTNEYQINLLDQYFKMASEKSFVSGIQVSNFADIKTVQSIVRLSGYNQMGVFTRDRRPKPVAYFLRDAWNKESSLNDPVRVSGSISK